MLPVAYDDILSALPRVHAVLPPTPLIEWPGLSQRLGCELYLKHENHQPVGAFKVRGGVNLAGSLTASERSAGLLGVSTGNHGNRWPSLPDMWAAPAPLWFRNMRTRISAGRSNCWGPT